MSDELDAVHGAHADKGREGRVTPQEGVGDRGQVPIPPHGWGDISFSTNVISYMDIFRTYMTLQIYPG